LQWPKGAPTDLSSGWSARLQIRPRADSADPALVDVSSTGSPPAIVLSAGSATLPNIVVTIPATATVALADTDDPLVYDLVLTRASDGYVRRLLKGKVMVERLVTREDA
jgi:hypothetical protein